MAIDLPDLDELEQLQPEEMGWLILTWIKENPEYMGSGQHERGNREKPLSFQRVREMYRHELNSPGQNTEQAADRAQRLLMEGWQWLEHSGLISAHHTEGNPVFKVITRRGMSIQSRSDAFDFSASQLLPEKIVHAGILLVVRSAFVRRDYDAAVFAAFREIELKVREATAADPSARGVKIVRDAFDAKSGFLTNQANHASERELLPQLFAGAIGVFKNPGSHRHTGIGVDEAVELIMFASRLLKIVDERLLASQESLVQ